MAGYPVVDAGPAAFRPLINPSISATPVGPCEIDGVGTASFVPHYLLAVFNAGDAVAAAAALKAGTGCKFIRPDSIREIHSDVAITRIDWIAVDARGAAPTDYTGNAFIVAKAETDAADWQAQMCTMTFDSADAVKSLAFEVSSVYSTNYATVSVSGASHV